MSVDDVRAWEERGVMPFSFTEEALDAVRRYAAAWPERIDPDSITIDPDRTGRDGQRCYTAELPHTTGNVLFIDLAVALTGYDPSKGDAARAIRALNERRARYAARADALERAAADLVVAEKSGDPDAMRAATEEAARVREATDETLEGEEVGAALQRLIVQHDRVARMVDEQIAFRVDAEIMHRYAAAFPGRLTITDDESQSGPVLSFPDFATDAGPDAGNVLTRAFQRAVGGGWIEGGTVADHVYDLVETHGSDEVGKRIAAALTETMQDDLAALEQVRHATEHEALDAQTRLAEFYSSTSGAAYAAGFIEAHPRADVIDPISTGKHLAASLAETMRTASTWFVSEEMRDLATWAAASLPASFTMTGDLPISPTGFVLIDGGLLVGADRQGRRNVIRAFAWYSADLYRQDTASHVGRGIAITFFVDRDDPRSTYYNLTPPFPVPRDVLFHSTGFTPGDPFSSWDADVQVHVDQDLDDVDPGVPGAATNPYRWLVSFWMLAVQPIAATRHHHAGRGAQRRAERAGIVAPEPGTVRVVTMRQVRERSDTDPANDTVRAGERRPYSHRFFVRPHWRRYHTKNGVEWCPVVGYVKGPDDKPFIAKNVVYEWAR